MQGLILWVPVEKLFMSEIGFTPASVGVMAAAYAAVVPVLEVPSGILADRWSRNRIMVLSCVALLASSAIGGLSRNVATYVVAAMVLGAYFALSSGTVDTRRREVLRVLLLSALVAMLSQAVFEFGPLWLVALAAPAILFGPYWAALMATLGLGGHLAAKLDLSRTRIALAMAVLAPATTATLALSRSLAAVVLAQTVLALLLAVVAISAGKLLHDAVPSTIRAGVSSGAGTASWLLFLPLSLVLGWLGRAHGVPQTGGVLTGAAVLVGALLVVSTRLARPAPAEPADHPVPPADLACQELVELVTDLLDGVLPPGWRDSAEAHLADCDGCTEYVRQIRMTIAALDALPSQPVPSD